MHYFLITMLSFFAPLAAEMAHEQIANDEYSLAYVHIGPLLPTYLSTAIAQARLFNPDCPIFLIGQKNALSKYDCTAENVTPIAMEELVPEELVPTAQHQSFTRNVPLQGQPRFGPAYH